MRAMLLAAGRGERMGPLTDTLPKPLLRLGQQTLIEYQLLRLGAAGIELVVINLSYRGAQIRALLGDGSRYGVRVAYSDEGEPPLETGGGIVNALPLLGAGLFVLLNADVATSFDLERFRRESRRNTLVLVANPPHHPHGDFGIDAAGHATLEPPLLTYSGIAMLDAGLFTPLPPGRRPLKPILDAAIMRGELWAERHDGVWFDVGTPARLRAAAAAVADGSLPMTGRPRSTRPQLKD